MLAYAQLLSAQSSDEDYSPSTLKRLALDQLVDVEITSVSRRPEPLSHAASAIDVITADEIRRSGSNNLPDTLRLATGLDVAQFDGHTWAISARGFNITTANKMQVLMDGRSLYTPLYSGVFWDVQSTFMPDIEQIEVIRGPGATLWGSNAVNGVINIRSKSAKETQGWIVQTGAGNEERGFGGIRYGGKVGDTYFRVYATGLLRDGLTLERLGNDGQDGYSLSQGGFRMDSEISTDDLLTLQGDIYTGRFGQLIGNKVEASGGNGIARWTRQLSSDSNVMLQAYYDSTHRTIPGVVSEDRDTFDLEFQHTFTTAEVHDVVWGLNLRVSKDQIGNLGPALAFLPDHETLYLYSGYIQDEFHVIPNLLTLTLGTKLEYNSFSGFEFEPSFRFALTPTPKQTIWGAVSRAVRTPTRIDQDLYAPNPAVAAPTILQSSRDFESETLIAYELGYRVKAAQNLTADLSLFYNDYDNLRSQEPVGAGPFPVTFANNLEGTSYGAELGVNWRPRPWWQLNLGYTLMDSHLHAKPGSHDTTSGRAEGNDPNNILVARSSIDLPGNVEFDTVFRYVSDRPSPVTPAYSTVDVRLAWARPHGVELALVGRNLLDQAHPEYRGGAVARELGRSVYFTVTWRF